MSAGSEPGDAAHSLVAEVADALGGLRESKRRRRIATAVAALLGLLAAAVDPLGILLGAALVALPARDRARGLAAGLGFGVLVLGLFVAELALAGSLGRAITTGTPFWLAVGAGLGGGLLGGLVRSVV